MTNRRCIHCEAVLPDQGDCAACSSSRSPEVLPAFLSRSLHLNRRSERDEAPTAAGSIDHIAPPPSIPPLAGPVGMTPRTDRQPGTTVLQRRRTPISLEALAPPLPAQPSPLPAPLARHTDVELDLFGDLESVRSNHEELVLERASFEAEAAPLASLEAMEAAPEVTATVAALADAAEAPEFPPATDRAAHEDIRARLAARLAADLAPAQDAADAAAFDEALADDEPLNARPAPLDRRLLASAVDGALVLTVGGLYLGLAQAVAGPAKLESLLLPGLALFALVAAVYATVGSLWGGRTLGQQVAGIRLVDGMGRAPAPTVALARALLGTVSAGLLGAGFWLALVDRRGQTLHDKLTSTFIVQPI